MSYTLATKDYPSFSNSQLPLPPPFPALAFLSLLPMGISGLDFILLLRVIVRFNSVSFLFTSSSIWLSNSRAIDSSDFSLTIFYCMLRGSKAVDMRSLTAAVAWSMTAYLFFSCLFLMLLWSDLLVTLDFSDTGEGTLFGSAPMDPTLLRRLAPKFIINDFFFSAFSPPSALSCSSKSSWSISSNSSLACSATGSSINSLSDSSASFSASTIGSGYF